MSEVTGGTPEKPGRRFRRYPQYQADEEREDEVPEAWDIMGFKRIARLAYGESLPADEREPGEVPVYGSNGPVGEHSEANTLAPALIVGRKGSYGKVNYVASIAFAIDTTFFIDARLTSSNIRWLYYAMQLLGLDEFSEDSAVPGLSREFVYNRTLPVPPLAEQGAIPEFLDRETGKIDSLVAKKEELIKLLQEKRTALITHAVTKGLDPNALMKDSGVVWLGEIPAHWTVTPLIHCTNRSIPIVYGILLPGPRLDDGVPYVGAGDVTAKKLKLELLPRTTREIAAEYTRSAIRKGELVYAIRGSFGNVEVVPAELDGVNLSRDAARIAPCRSISASWLCWALKAESSQKYFNYHGIGTAVTGVNIRDLKRVPLAVPPVEYQHAIDEFLTRRVHEFDSLIGAIERGISRLQELRTALISAVVTGKIDVREEVP